jgi:hypothetical protein
MNISSEILSVCQAVLLEVIKTPLNKFQYEGRSFFADPLSRVIDLTLTPGKSIGMEEEKYKWIPDILEALFEIWQQEMVEGDEWTTEKKKNIILRNITDMFVAKQTGAEVYLGMEVWNADYLAYTSLEDENKIITAFHRDLPKLIVSVEEGWTKLSQETDIPLPSVHSELSKTEFFSLTTRWTTRNDLTYYMRKRKIYNEVNLWKGIYSMRNVWNYSGKIIVGVPHTDEEKENKKTNKKKEEKVTVVLDQKLSNWKCYFLVQHRDSCTLEELGIIQKYHDYFEVYTKVVSFHCCSMEGQQEVSKAYSEIFSEFNQHKEVLLKTDFAKPPNLHLCTY